MVGRSRRSGAEQQAATGQLFLLDAVGQRAVMADAKEAIRQDVLEEAAEEFLGGKESRLEPVAVAAVAIGVTPGATCWLVQQCFAAISEITLSSCFPQPAGTTASSKVAPVETKCTAGQASSGTRPLAGACFLLPRRAPFGNWRGSGALLDTVTSGATSTSPPMRGTTPASHRERTSLVAA